MEHGMEDMIRDEEIESILRGAFKSEKLPTRYRDQLLLNLIIMAGDIMKDNKKNFSKRQKRHFWKKPELWLSVATAIIIAVISYGIWLPFSVWDKLTS